MQKTVWRHQQENVTHLREVGLLDCYSAFVAWFSVNYLVGYIAIFSFLKLLSQHPDALARERRVERYLSEH